MRGSVCRCEIMHGHLDDIGHVRNGEELPDRGQGHVFQRRDDQVGPGGNKLRGGMMADAEVVATPFYDPDNKRQDL